MVQKGLLSEVKLPNIKNKYEISKKPHAHFVCQKCSKVEDIEIDSSCIEKDLGKNFLVKDIDISVVGICKECEKKADSR